MYVNALELQTVHSFVWVWPTLITVLLCVNMCEHVQMMDYYNELLAISVGTLAAKLFSWTISMQYTTTLNANDFSWHCPEIFLACTWQNAKQMFELGRIYCFGQKEGTFILDILPYTLME